MASVIVVSGIIEKVISVQDLGDAFAGLIGELGEQANGLLDKAGLDDITYSDVKITYIESRDCLLVAMMFLANEAGVITEEAEGDVDRSYLEGLEKFEHQNLLVAHAEGAIEDYKIGWESGLMKASVRTSDGRAVKVVSDGEGEWYVEEVLE